MEKELRNFEFPKKSTKTGTKTSKCSAIIAFNKFPQNI